MATASTSASALYRLFKTRLFCQNPPKDRLPNRIDERQMTALDDSSVQEQEEPTGDFAGELDYDSHLLHRTVADAGRWAFGIVAVEVWVLSDDMTRLNRPPYGWWLDPVFHDHNRASCHFNRLTDSTRKDFIPPMSYAPGVGVPGTLWAEASQAGPMMMRRSKMGSSEFFSPLPKNVFWRNLKQLHMDPDQPHNPRLNYLVESGMGWAAAVPFDFNDYRGIVIFFARGTVDMGRLRSRTNEEYIVSASQLIGAAFALRGPRHRIVQERRNSSRETFRRVKESFMKKAHAGMDLKSLVMKEQSPVQTKVEEAATTLRYAFARQGSLYMWSSKLMRRLLAALKKSKGGGAPIPPAFIWSETALTFVGAFLTLAAVVNIHDAAVRNFGTRFDMPTAYVGIDAS